MLKKVFIVIIVLIIGLFIFLETYTPPISKNNGKLNIELFLGGGTNQPLIVGFGGGEGGNAWASDYWKETRDDFLKQGYAFLAIGYFGMSNISENLDRIPLDAIYDSIMSIAQNTKINKDKIALIGGSKGAELVLNLASAYKDFDAVVGLVPSHVSFPAVTIMANTSSWKLNNEEVVYVPASYSTIPAAINGDLHKAFSIMLENEDAVEKAAIPVERINGSILLLSAKSDELWPSTYMSDQIIERLDKNRFKHHYQHIAYEGSHAEPLNHFDEIFKFLELYFK